MAGQFPNVPKEVFSAQESRQLDILIGTDSLNLMPKCNYGPDCKDCKNRMRADHLEDSKCLHCGSTNLTDPRPFNLIFKTNIGPVADDESYAYLRPETAQQIFTNFKNVVDSTS